jgi:hypothetical protein
MDERSLGPGRWDQQLLIAQRVSRATVILQVHPTVPPAPRPTVRSLTACHARGETSTARRRRG